MNVVRHAILDFELKPGDRLIERELMERLQVSRTTVRDVLARLGAEGLVTNVPQKGAIVTVVTRQDATDIYEMRALLEPLAVRCFIERALPSEVRELRVVVDELVESSQQDDADAEPGASMRAKNAFYVVLLNGARSPKLTQVLSALQSQVQFLRAMSLSVPGRPAEAAREISAIVDAIEAGDTDAAESACALHIRNAAAAGLVRLGSSHA